VSVKSLAFARAVEAGKDNSQQDPSST
jgi:hypothetical protein